MFEFPIIDPVAVAIGPFKIHWYGLSYILAFVSAYFIAKRLCRRPGAILKVKDLEDIGFYVALGVIAGGRLGYVLFYNFELFLHDPIWLFKIWTGGMSFHGGFLGVVVALWLYAKKHKLDVVRLFDFSIPTVPLGLGFGRIANFIGQELWGRPTNSSWGMIFPNDPDSLYRHPSQLYQAFFEGLVLFILMYYLSTKIKMRAIMSCAFMFFYGTFRFFLEFFREPDQHIQFDFFGWMTRGQILSMAMVLFSIIAFYFATNKLKNAHKIFQT